MPDIANEFDSINPGNLKESKIHSSGRRKKGDREFEKRKVSFVQKVNKLKKDKELDTFLALESYCIDNFATEKLKADPNESENAPVVVEEYEDSSMSAP